MIADVTGAMRIAGKMPASLDRSSLDFPGDSNRSRLASVRPLRPARMGRSRLESLARGPWPPVIDSRCTVHDRAPQDSDKISIFSK